MAFKIGNQTVLDIDIGGATKIESATDKDVVLNPGPGGEIYVSVGTSVTFEGSNPADDFEGRLKATTLTSDRYYILPDTVNSIVAVLDATAFPTGDITTYVDTAEADAISSSNLYTDGRETAITTTYQAYADQAEADAIASAASDATTKANAALSSANTYTDAAITNNVDFTGYAQESYVDTAEADAIASAEAKDVVRASAAASDATTKADAAQAAAISAAAADATTKANTAKAEAISEVTNGAGAAFDTLVEIQNAMATDAELSSAISSVTTSAASTAASDATTKANAAQAAAISTAASDATTKANAAQAAAISSAASDATTKANAAQSAAQSYADANDANTTYTAGNGMTLSGTQFLMSGAYTGNFTATGDITAYSDDSLKTNVQLIDGALDRVQAIRGVTFDRISDGSTSTGVIAQELKAVLPEAVHTDANGVHSVAYGNITGLLIEAVKELSDQVNSLKSK